MYIHTLNNEKNQFTDGSLIIDVKTSTDTGAVVPVAGVKILVLKQDEDKTYKLLTEYNTDEVGATPIISLEAPPIIDSLEEEFTKIPYSTYRVEARSDNFIPVIIEGVQIFSGIKSILPINLIPTNEITLTRSLQETIHIEVPTLYGDYPPKIPEIDIKDTNATGFVVLSEVVIPEYIVVHAGSPNNNSAPNYTVPYKDYIKNVASSEIYPTWPKETIRANVIAIISYTLNRVYTEWYRNQGKNFTITNSTAYDHAFTYGRNIFDTISAVVDENFDMYVKRPGVTQPLLTQYCDGRKVFCPGWMTQWGSEQLGRDGLGAEEILKHFYRNIEFRHAKIVYGNPESYPGYALKSGYESPPVRTIQEQLNRISQTYPLIPKVPSNGIFGPETVEAVKIFQKVFHLTPDGVIGKSTWYKISEIYVAVTKIGSLI
ncbi:peptidoglycan-binding protein [Candidatus Epulonipiscioides gigas]|nr:peptidoglycan-binding protein [Epulopiscium sp. SCG-C07WGA-EpuloA2]